MLGLHLHALDLPDPWQIGDELELLDAEMLGEADGDNMVAAFQEAQKAAAAAPPKAAPPRAAPPQKAAAPSGTGAKKALSFLESLSQGFASFTTPASQVQPVALVHQEPGWLDGTTGPVPNKVWQRVGSASFRMSVATVPA